MNALCLGHLGWGRITLKWFLALPCWLKFEASSDNLKHGFLMVDVKRTCSVWCFCDFIMTAAFVISVGWWSRQGELPFDAIGKAQEPSRDIMPFAILGAVPWMQQLDDWEFQACRHELYSPWNIYIYLFYLILYSVLYITLESIPESIPWKGPWSAFASTRQSAKAGPQ